MWPRIIDLELGETFTLGESTLTLLAVRNEQWAPDYWIKNNPARRVLVAVDVVVDVSGVQAVITARPYALPVEVNGLMVYVETTRTWAMLGEIEQMPRASKLVRLSVTPAGQPWSPPGGLVFPIRDYRWRAASYANTWGALVPYNLHYYHRGDDFGAIPDQLPVVAMRAGQVIAVPQGRPSGSNTVMIESEDGIAIVYAHMNIETIDPALKPGVWVEAGQPLGKTGCTWDGYRSQSHDPHLHIGFHRRSPGESSADFTERGDPFSTYPFLIEAFFQTYPDQLLPVAGGYHFALPGQPVVLDGSRSAVRPGCQIAAYRWRLHDGREVDTPSLTVTYDRPGLYSEELSVTTTAGIEDRDFAQVRVYDPERGNDMAWGWVFANPVREIRPGTPVAFWNRLLQTRCVTVDFGDNTPPVPIESETGHVYTQPGLYTVTFTGLGPADEPVMAKLRVLVEP